MKLSSTAKTVQSDTQAPHMMQAITPVRCCISSAGARYSVSRLRTFGLEPRLHLADLAPEGLEVNDEVFLDLQVARRLDDDGAAVLGQRVDD